MHRTWGLFLALSVGVVVAGGGCKFFKQKVGDKCQTGQGACLDAKNELSCQSGVYISMPCKGAKGCDVSGSKVTCDISANLDGDPCSTEDEDLGACAGDKKSMVACNKGKFAVIPCRGAKACNESGSKIDCDTNLASVGDNCENDDSHSCSPDHADMVVCSKTKVVLNAHCRGPKKCDETGSKIECDISLQQAGDPCDAKNEGTYSCSADASAILTCKGGTMTQASLCRGPKKCDASGDKVKCDMDVAAAGDVCESGMDGKFACGTDMKSILKCSGGKFVADRKCYGGCVIGGDDLECN